MAASATDAAQVSPLAATVPLTEEGRVTNNFAADDPLRAAPETTRVNRAELEALIRPEAESESPAASAAPFIRDGQKTVVDENSYRAHPSARATPEGGRAAPPPPEDFVTRTRPPYDYEPNDKTLIVERPGAGERSADDDDETIVSAAASSAAVVRPPVSSAVAAAAATSPPQVSNGAQSARGSGSARRKIGLIAAIVGAVLVCLAMVVTAAWLAASYFRRPVIVANSGDSSPIPVEDPKQLFDEKVAEAEALLAGGDIDGAIASLREANRLDPSNTRAHLRLGDILLESGRRREAIEEYQAVTLNDPDQPAAWRVLAAAQTAEGLYDAAVVSYRRLLALTSGSAGGGAGSDANDLLAYAEALRLAGRTEEARAAYQNLTASLNGEVANAARSRLAELTIQSPAAGEAAVAATAPSPAESARRRDPRATQNESADALTAPPPTSAAAPSSPPPAPRPAESSAALSPAERYKRGVELWAANNRAAALAEFRAAAGTGNPDAYYYLGLSIAEGKDPRSLKRAELGAALQYFQLAKRGRFRAEAQKYEDQLGPEFDRRRNQ